MLFRKIDKTSGILFRKIGVRNRYVFDASMAFSDQQVVKCTQGPRYRGSRGAMAPSKISVVPAYQIGTHIYCIFRPISTFQ